MTEQPISIPVDLDTQGFVAGAGQAGAAADSLNSKLGALTVGSGSLRGAFDAMTPGKASLAAMGAFAALAANQQQRMSGLSATAKVTGVNVATLATGVRQMARDMPLGSKASLAVVEQFTKMGVAAKGSEVQIGRLSKSVLQLSGATGEGPGQLAEGMTQLARATGNTNLDPKRFSALADSLTTVSKMSGASATSVLAFAKNIAPMAQASGIGATGVLGISSAFSRLGEDGVGASTAVNKMLTDMSRSVREGGPQMLNYAEIVGKSADQFERLFKANPTEALTQVTEAIANAGTKGPRLLEQAGIDGIRGQRAFQALSASGGLRSAVATATAAYGNDSTQKASEAAFSGLNDKLIELRESSTQLAEALGAPLLTPLTKFAEGLKVPVGIAGRVAGSGPVQTALTGAAYLAMAAMLAKAITGPLAAMGLGRQALTSGPVRGFLGGIAESRGTTGFMSRYGAGVIAADTAGTLGSANTKFLEAGRGFGRGLGPATGGSGLGTIPTMIQGARGAITSAATLNYNMAKGSLYNASETNPLNRIPITANAGTPWVGGWTEMQKAWTNRGVAVAGPSMAVPASTAASAPAPAPFKMPRPGQTWGPAPIPAGPGTLGGFGMGPMGASLAGGGPGAIGAVTKALGTFKDRLLVAGEGMGGFGRTGAAALRVGIGTAEIGAKMAGDVAKLGVKGLGMMPGGIGANMGLSLGIAGAGMGLAHVRSQSAEIASKQDMDIHQAINSYREAIGLATAATISLGSQLTQLGKTVSVSVKSVGDATNVSATDIGIAGGAKGKQTHDYAGTNSQVAAQIGLLNAGGLGPQELQAVKIDLLKSNRTTGDVQAIMDKLSPATTAGGTGSVVGSAGAEMASAITGASSDKRTGFGGWFARHGALGGAWNTDEGFASKPGGFAHVDSLGSGAKQQIDVVAQNMGQRFAAQSSSYGVGYAKQEEVRGAQTAMAAAMKTGNVDLIDKLGKELSQTLTGVKGGVDISMHEQQQAGGWVQALAARNPAFASDFGGASLTGKGITAKAATSFYATEMRASGGAGAFADMYDANNAASKSTAGKSLAAALALPEDTKLLSKASVDMTDSAHKAGMSFAEVAAAAIKATQSMSSDSVPYGIQMAVAGQAQQEMSNQQRGQTPAANLKENIALATSQATMQPTTKAQQDQVTQGKENLAGYKQQLRDTLAGELMARYQYITAKKRADHDFALQVEYANQDYIRAKDRANRNFNLSMTRMEEDAAKTLYNVYDRIATQPTWDTANLLDNSKQQTQAMEKQTAQLKAIRKKGLSQQAIDLLELYKPENAQQLNTMTGDIKNDPSQIKQLNTMAAQRAAAAKALQTDPSNTDTRRAKQDHAISMSDMAADVTRASDRAHVAFKTGTDRMTQDFKVSQETIGGDYKALAKQVDKGIHDQTINWTKLMVDDTAALIAVAAGTPAALAKALGVPTDSFKDFQKAAAAASMPGVSITPSTSTGGMTVASAAADAKAAKTAKDSADHAAVHGGGRVGSRHARGGIAMREHFMGEAGPEAIIPLDGRGVAMMAKAFSDHLTQEQRRTMTSANSTMVVNHHETITYDSRNDFGNANITVVAQDPDAMGRKLAAKKRTQNLTSTKGVKWSTT